MHEVNKELINAALNYIRERIDDFDSDIHTTLDANDPCCEDAMDKWLSVKYNILGAVKAIEGIIKEAI